MPAALIDENGLVIQVALQGLAEDQKPQNGATWIDCADGVRPVPGQMLINGEFHNPPPDLGAERQAAIATLNDEHASILRSLTNNATVEERDTWQAKALAALAYDSGNASATQTDMLETEAAMAGETTGDLVATILAKNAAYQKMIGLASGHRRKTIAALNAASDIAELRQVGDHARAQADTLIQQFLAATTGGGS